MFRQTAKLAIGMATISSAGLTFLSVTPAASAFVFNGSSVEDITSGDVGQSFMINFDGNVNRTQVDGLTSWAKFTLQSFTGTQAIFNIDLENTSTGSITSRTSALGFDIDGATVSGATVSGSLFANAHINDSLPNGFGDIDVCFINNKNNCKGGGGEGNDGGVSTGEGVSTFTATVELTESVQSFAMSNFGVRYQSIEGAEDLGTSGTGRGTPYYQEPKPKAIPEPSTVTAVLVSGFALVQQRRRKQTTKNEC
jgi:hypothetical protein